MDGDFGIKIPRKKGDEEMENICFRIVSYDEKVQHFGRKKEYAI